MHWVQSHATIVTHMHVLLLGWKGFIELAYGLDLILPIDCYSFSSLAIQKGYLQNRLCGKSF